MSRWAAVLAGGSGTRFWPLSSGAHPKQMLPLAGPNALLADGVARLQGLIPEEQILVVTAAALAEPTRRLLSQLPPENILAEPKAASTGPALAWATTVVRSRDPDGALLSMHADWWVGDDEAFRTTAARALEVAVYYDALVTVGIVPTRPDVGFGYIEPGGYLEDDVRAVARFTEKPNAVRAAQLVQQGALWNSGLFAWSVPRFFAESSAHAPEIAPHLPLIEAGDVEAYFRSVTPIAIDISHLERSGRVVVVPGNFPWDDVGTWAALFRIREADTARNVVVGEAFVRESVDSVVWAEDGPVVVDGVCGLVIVRANGRVLVTTRERAVNLKQVLEAMPEEMRELDGP